MHHFIKDVAATLKFGIKIMIVRDIIIVRKTGGTRGNSSRGVNYGNVGNPNPTTVMGVQSNVVHRSGALQLYAVEWALIENCSIERLFALLHEGWNAYPAAEITVNNGDIFQNGSWVIPASGQFRQSPVKEAARLTVDHFNYRWVDGARIISEMWGTPLQDVIKYYGLPNREAVCYVAELRPSGWLKSVSDTGMIPVFRDPKKELERLRHCDNAQ